MPAHSISIKIHSGAHDVPATAQLLCCQISVLQTAAYMLSPVRLSVHLSDGCIIQKQS